MYDHSLNILRREGIEAYATVIGRPVKEAYNIAIRELTGVPDMEGLREDIILDRDELLLAEQELELGRARQMIGFAVVVIALIGCLTAIGYVMHTTSTFVQRDLPRLVR